MGGFLTWCRNSSLERQAEPKPSSVSQCYLKDPRRPLWPPITNCRNLGDASLVILCLDNNATEGLTLYSGQLVNVFQPPKLCACSGPYVFDHPDGQSETSWESKRLVVYAHTGLLPVAHTSYHLPYHLWVSTPPALPCRAEAAPEAARLLAEAFGAMCFSEGFLHCDPHPGNLLVELPQVTDE